MLRQVHYIGDGTFCARALARWRQHALLLCSTATMAVPTYQFFIEPILRYLALHESSTAGEAGDAAARELRLTDADRALLHKSGSLIYKYRAGWAFDRLKRAGFASNPSFGIWQLTASGREFAKANPTLTNRQLTKLAAAKTRPQPGETRPQPAIKRARSPRSEGAPGSSVGPIGDRKAYRLPSQPIAIGGQAEVFEATRKADSKIFVLKRVRGMSGEKRMRREIEIQSSLEHVNIMPILDWDNANFTWYVMPRGKRAMSELARPVDRQLLCQIVESVAAALEFAHAAGNPHRDVKPHNIIELADDQGKLRWALADWGLTRRPLGETTSELTKTGHPLGTDGYAPPEAYQDPHNVGLVGDIYGLGQVIAWATGVDPVPNMVPNVAEPWRRLVEPMTRLEPQKRIQTISEVRSVLQSICNENTALLA